MSVSPKKPRSSPALRTRCSTFALLLAFAFGVALSAPARAHPAIFLSSLTFSCRELFATAQSPEERIVAFYTRLLAEYRLMLDGDEKYGELLTSFLKTKQYFVFPVVHGEPEKLREYLQLLETLKKNGSLPSGEKIERESLEKKLHAQVEAEWKLLTHTAETVRRSTDQTRTLRTLVRTLKGHTNAVREIIYSPDLKQALSRSDDYNLILWDLSTGKPRYELKSEYTWISVHVNPSFSEAMGITFNGVITHWDLKTGEVIRVIKGHGHLTNDISMTPDLRHALSWKSGHVLVAWDLNTGEVLKSFPVPQTWMNDIRVSANFEKAITGDNDGRLTVWDLKTGEHLKEMKEPTKWVKEIQVNANFERAVTSSKSGHLVVWDLTTGKILREMDEPTGPVTSILVSPDFKTLLTAAKSGNLILWDLKTGSILEQRKISEIFLRTTVIRPDFKRALSGDEHGDIFDWDLELF